MHIPDGFINGVTSLGAGAVAAGGLGAALRQAGRSLKERQVPLAGLVAAFIFALQMVNFPVAAGTSGHLLGGALAAILLGPWLGMVVLSVVIIVQALLFADGGISALGLNLVNMALLTTLSAWVVFRLARALLRARPRALVAASFVAAWVSVVVSAAGFAVEYALGGTGGVSPGTVLAAMTGVHAFIGIGEGAITAGVVAAVLAVRPDLVYGGRVAPSARPVAAGALVAAGLLLAAGLAAGIGPFADPDPDGLERVAIDQGFADSAVESPVSGSPLAGYRVPWLGDDRMSTAVAGLAGTLIAFGAGGLVVAARRRRVEHNAAAR